ncbi:hypothetical protein [Novosphingobium sp.]|uniref:hypothetical protein n=1 Tax=Novosphingobium sp. TaxID=1874826 RepID=UPI00262E855F|nr:hypothetical protein [Novosphingobium sp.]
MPGSPQRKQAISLILALALPLGACSGQTAPGAPAAITDAAPGSYEYARQCFRALGLQALISGSGTPTSQDVMDRASALATAAGKKEGMSGTDVLTDLLRQTGEGASSFQSMPADQQAAYASASQAFAKTCLEAQH